MVSERIDDYNRHTIIKAVRAYKILVTTRLDSKIVNTVTDDTKAYANFDYWKDESFVLESGWRDEKYNCLAKIDPPIGKLEASKCSGFFTVRTIKDEEKLLV